MNRTVPSAVMIRKNQRFLPPLTDGVLTIQGNDAVSGISAVTVNGTTYTELSDGKLKVQLTQKDFTTKQIEITVTDGAGNTSDKYTSRTRIMNGRYVRHNSKVQRTAI